MCSTWPACRGSNRKREFSMATISNPYHMEHLPKERTPIYSELGPKPLRCQSCGRTQKPRVIRSKFLSRPLKVCEMCRSVIQESEG
jgi:hypothetical protein